MNSQLLDVCFWEVASYPLCNPVYLEKDSSNHCHMLTVSAYLKHLFLFDLDVHHREAAAVRELMMLFVMANYQG